MAFFGDVAMKVYLYKTPPKSPTCFPSPFMLLLIVRNARRRKEMLVAVAKRFYVSEFSWNEFRGLLLSMSS